MSNTSPFPTSEDSFIYPLANQHPNNPSLAAILAQLNDAVFNVETKVGVDTSAVVTTLDYLIKNSASVDPGHKHTSSSYSGDALTGWIGVSDAWTFASSTTITIPAGGLTKYAKGDKLKLTQGGSVKYFYIVGVADTILTITGGSDYTLANSAISAISIARGNAVGFPDSFNFSATASATGSMTYSVGSILHVFQFKINGSSITYNIYNDSTTGGTASYGITIGNLPIGIAATFPNLKFGGGGNDGSGTISLNGYISNGVNSIEFRKYDGSNWGIGSSRVVSCSVTLPY